MAVNRRMKVVRTKNLVKARGLNGPEKMGDFIAALRKSKGLTQKEVAERLNISNKTVSKWERETAILRSL